MLSLTLFHALNQFFFRKDTYGLHNNIYKSEIKSLNRFSWIQTFLQFFSAIAIQSFCNYLSTECSNFIGSGGVCHSHVAKFARMRDLQKPRLL